MGCFFHRIDCCNVAVELFTHVTPLDFIPGFDVVPCIGKEPALSFAGFTLGLFRFVHVFLSFLLGVDFRPQIRTLS